MAKQITVCPVADLPPGAVTGAGPYAIGNIDGKYFAVTRRCRHLRADLAGGSIEDGRLVCPWHQSAYDVENGQMVRGPQQIFAKIPGLGTTFKMLTKVWPLDLGAKALGRANSNLVALDQCWWLHHRVAAINLRRLIALGLDKINGPWMIPATT